VHSNVFGGKAISVVGFLRFLSGARVLGAADLLGSVVQYGSAFDFEAGDRSRVRGCPWSNFGGLLYDESLHPAQTRS